METVTITIGRSSVYSDMRVKSHAEVASIEDDKERYLAELGSEKEQEAHQCITEAFAEGSALLRQFVPGTVTSAANDAYSGSGDLVLALSLSTRKASGLTRPLTDALHAYVVDAALALFYRAVSRPALAEAHASSLASDAAVIQGIVYRRGKPSYPTT